MLSNFGLYTKASIEHCFAENILANAYIAYFGYGSLVNQATHRTEIAGITRARLKGWRRQWLARPKSVFGPIAMLSVVPDPNSEIDGLVVTDHADNLAAVDEREAGYGRELVHSAGLQYPDLNGADIPPVNIYIATPEKAVENLNECQILRSYLDAVMQGYFNKFGQDGLHRFVQTTNNFEIGVREDRSKPIYPRQVVTTAKERSLFDTLVPPAK